jgi:hypothetical protein
VLADRFHRRRNRLRAAGGLFMFLMKRALLVAPALAAIAAMVAPAQAG